MNGALHIVETVQSGDALVRRLRQLIDGAQKADPLAPVTVITPSHYSSFFLRRAVAMATRAGEPGTGTNAPVGLFNVEFERVDDLADQLAAPYLGQRKPLDRFTAAQFVVEATTHTAPQTGLAPGGAHAAFHTALHRTLSELDAAGPDAIERLERLGGRLAGVAALAREYKRLSDGFFDRAEVSHAAAKTVREGPERLRKPGSLVVLLAEEPPPQYRDFIEALRSLPSTRVIEALPDLDAHTGSPVIGPDNTYLISAPDRAEEVRRVVRNVVRSAREGVRLGDIAVFYSDNEYAGRFDEAFRTAGVPVSGPDRQAPAGWPEGEFITGLLESRRELSRDEVAAWLTSSPVLSPATGSLTPGSRWDAVSRSAGVTKGRDSWEHRMATYIKRKTAEALRADRGAEDEEEGGAAGRAAQAEAQEAQALLDFIRQFAAGVTPPAGSWASHVNWLHELQSKYLAPPVGPAARERRERVDSLVDRIATLDIIGITDAGLERFEATVAEELSRPVGRLRPLGQGVFLAHCREAAGTVFDVVHIVGMAEGSYPFPDTPDPLLPDSARKLLDDSGRFLPRREHRRAQQRGMFESAVGAGRRRFLSWPRSEAGAYRESAPSAWFLEAARQLSGDNTLQAGGLASAGRGKRWWERLDRAERSLHTVEAPGDRHEYELIGFARFVESGGSAEAHPLAANGAGLLADAIALEKRRYSANWTEYDGNLSERASRRPPAEFAPASPTSYQEWAACPFRYFLGHVLKAEPQPSPEEPLEISAQDRGRLVHTVLEKFVNTRAARGPADLATLRWLLTKTADEAFDAFEGEALTGSAVLWQAEKRRILRGLLGWLARANSPEAAQPESTHAEVSFGFPDSRLPAVSFEMAPGQTLSFRGVMDRLDVHAGGSRVAVYDYKTGDPGRYKAPGGDEVAGGKLLQLPVYGLAASQWPGGGPVQSITAAYWFVMRPGADEFLPQPTMYDHARAVESLRRAAAVIGQGISLGLYPARPGRRKYDPQTGVTGHENCNTCDFKRVCPSGKAWLWEHKRGHPDLARYRAMAESGGPLP